MIQKVVTGGQTGVEQAAWAAARREGIATGGYMSGGFLTEDGPAPRLGALYGAIEFPFDDARRTCVNLRRADGLFWFGDPDSSEARETFAACRELARPFLTLDPGFFRAAVGRGGLAERVRDGDPRRGRRPRRRSPGIGPRVEAFLDRVFAGRPRATMRTGKPDHRRSPAAPIVAGTPSSPTASGRVMRRGAGHEPSGRGPGPGRPSSADIRL